MPVFGTSGVAYGVEELPAGQDDVARLQRGDGLRARHHREGQGE